MAFPATETALGPYCAAYLAMGFGMRPGSAFCTYFAFFIARVTQNLSMFERRPARINLYAIKVKALCTRPSDRVSRRPPTWVTTTGSNLNRIEYQCSITHHSNTYL